MPLSTIFQQSGILVEETGVPEKTIDLSQVTDKLDHIIGKMRQNKKTQRLTNYKDRQLDPYVRSMVDMQATQKYIFIK